MRFGTNILSIPLWVVVLYVGLLLLTVSSSASPSSSPACCRSSYTHSLCHLLTHRLQQQKHVISGRISSSSSEIGCAWVGIVVRKIGKRLVYTVSTKAAQLFGVHAIRTIDISLFFQGGGRSLGRLCRQSNSDTVQSTGR